MAAVALAAAPALAAVRVVATTTDLASLVAGVGGDLVIVESIVPAGADPEAFEPRPGDLGKLRRADLLACRAWLRLLARRAGQPKRGARGGGANLTPPKAFHCSRSVGRAWSTKRAMLMVSQPHYWLDPENASHYHAASPALARLAPGERGEGFSRA
jgi:ABC-type Zn uptake system ZnuABC Zn-binding protein ZnuA